MNNPSGYPDNNPKTVLGVQKTPLHLVPPSAKYHLAAAFADGAEKYGPYNWRDNTVSASIYVAAAQRHIDDWWDGEDLSRDAKVHHLAHAMACMAILLDAMSIGMLNDDRPSEGAATDLHEEYAENKKKEKDDWRNIGDPVEYSGLSYIQEDVLPADLTGWWFRGYDGKYEYWQSPNGGVARYDTQSSGRVQDPTVGGLFSGRGEPFNSLYDLTQGNSCGPVPVATGNGDSESTWPYEPTELRVHDDRRADPPVHMGDGRSDAGVGSGGKYPT